MTWTYKASESYAALFKNPAQADALTSKMLTWPDDFPAEYHEDEELRAFRVDGLSLSFTASATAGQRRGLIRLVADEEQLVLLVTRFNVTAGNTIQIVWEGSSDRDAAVWSGSNFGQEPLPVNLVIGHEWSLELSIQNVQSGDFVTHFGARGRIIETPLSAP